MVRGCHFRPLDGGTLSGLEQVINRRLPEDFRLFLTTFGSGRFPTGGNVYTPDDMLAACHGPMLMRLGCSEWASDADQRRLYISHGSYNPAPDRFTDTVLNADGFNLLDLLQFGTDGSCGYHQLYVGADPRPFGYCLLHESEIYDRLPSFTAALQNILQLRKRLDL